MTTELVLACVVTASAMACAAAQAGGDGDSALRGSGASIRRGVSPSRPASWSVSRQAAQTTPEAVKKQLAAEYAVLARAYRTKSIQPILDRLTPDFQRIRPDGPPLDRKGMEESLRKQFKEIGKEPEVTSTVRNVKLSGGQAIAEVDGTLKFTFVDKSGQTQVVRHKQTTRATWVKQGGAWRMKRAEPIDIDDKLGSGRPVQLNRRPADLPPPSQRQSRMRGFGGGR